MYRRLTLLIALLLTALGLTACGGADAAPRETTASITVKHAQGETTLTGVPARVVVMDFGTLDTMRALGLSDRVVGLPKRALPGFLKEFGDEKYADVGTLAEPNYEAINKLDPDLVIIGFRSAASYPEMSKHFPTIDVTYREQDIIEGTGRVAGIIGQAFDKKADVDAKMGALRAKADGYRSVGISAGRGLIVMTSGGKISIQGASSRFGSVHTLLGVPQAIDNIAADNHGQAASFELLAETNPDVMFVVDRDAAIGTEGGQNARQILDNELVHQTNAWKNDRLIMLDGSRWYVAMHGLDNAGAMVDEAAKGLGA